MRLCIVLWLIFSCAQIAFTQPVWTTIQGTVTDSLYQGPLGRATVMLLAQDNSLQTKTQLTDIHGHFSFSIVMLKEYKLQISYVGYRTWSRLIKSSRESIQSYIVRLEPQIQHLDEIRVQAASPVRFKKDTIEYRVDSFSTPSNSILEELLKKLPGLEVHSDGTVTAQGQVVQQLYVDGKPFFGSDLRLATQNLPASIIKAIQVYGKRSDKSIFSGIDDGSRSKTINIVTKPEGKQRFFGQQAAGLGTAKRYQAGISLNKFGKEQQFSLIGQANNINQPGYSLSASVNRANLANNASNSQGQSGGITQSVAAGLNYSDKWGERLNVNMHYLFSSASIEVQQISHRQTALPAASIQPDSSASQSYFFTDNRLINLSRTGHHSLNLRVDYQLDPINVIQFTPMLSVSPRHITSLATTCTHNYQQPLNQSNTQNFSNGTNLNLDNTLLWMHRFKQAGRTFSAEFKQSISYQDDNAINRSQNIFYHKSSGPDSLEQNLNNQLANQHTQLLSNQWALIYVEPVSVKTSLILRYQLGLKRNVSERFVIDANPYTNVSELIDSLLSNQYQSDLITHRIGMDWQIRQSKYSCTIGLDFQQTRLNSASKTGAEAIDHSYINLLPNLTLQPKLAPNHYLQFQYQSLIVAPTILQLQPVANITNPLFIQIGNPDLRPEYIHQAGLTYNSFQTTTYQTVFAQINVGVTGHRIVNSIRIDSMGVQTIHPINTNGYATLSGSFSLSRPIKAVLLNSTLNLTTNISLVRAVGFINDHANPLVTVQASQGLTWNATLSKLFEIGLSALVNYQTANYSLQTVSRNHSINSIIGGRLYCPLPFGFKLSTDIIHNATSGRSSGYNQAYLLWNGYLSRSFLRKQQGEFRVQAFDLLNQNRSSVRTVAETYIEDKQSQVLGRYLILSFIYNLRHFGADNRP